MDKIHIDVKPMATPSEAELAAWNELPRDEQMRRLREELSHPDACVAGNSNMVEVWAKIKARRGGG